MTALRARVDTGRNGSGSELFSVESAATLDAYMEVLKPGLGYAGIICHGGRFLPCSIMVREDSFSWLRSFLEAMTLQRFDQTDCSA